MQIILPPYHRRKKINKTSIGGKAFHLWKMQTRGFPVPEFFVLPSETIDKLIAPVRNEIEDICSILNDQEDIQLNQGSTGIQKIILTLKIPALLLQELEETCHTIFGEHFFVAVRSSAISEDGSNFSFAGQHSSFLYVNKDGLSAAILKVISSGWSFSALKYRIIHGLPLKDIKFSVVIQRMIDAARSGIGFSMNLKGNMADMVLVAGYGLGEGIVSDKVEPDTYTVNRRLRTVEKEISDKVTSLTYSSEKGLCYNPVENSLTKVPVLTDQQIFEVCNYLALAENLLGVPADIEYSFDKNSKLYILQVRPITTLNRDKIKILDNTNIVESYPGLTLPLTFSFAAKAYEKVFTGSARAFMIPRNTIREYTDVFENLLYHVNGRIYYRLDNWYRMLALVHHSRKSLKAWEQAVGLTEGESHKVNFTFSSKARTIFSSVKLMINYKRGNKRFFKRFHENYSLLRDYSQHLSSPAELWTHYERATALLFQPWHLTIVNDFLAFKCFGWLQNFIKKNKIGENEELANDLLCGLGKIESEEAIIMVLELKEEIKSNAELTNLFTKPAAEILFELKQGNYKEFYQRVNDYLEKFGDRTLAELKLETRSLRRNPELFIGMLRNQILSGTTAGDYRKKQLEIRTNARNKVNARLKGWNPKKIVFNMILQLARYGLRNRENMRFCRTRGYSAVKDIFSAIGKMMVEKKIIQKQEDIFYLDIPDLKSFCTENKMENKEMVVADLKKKYLQYSGLNLPDRIIFIDEDLPVFDKNIKNVSTDAGCFKGISVSKGVIIAEAIVIAEPRLDLDVHGKILISKMTDPGWTFLMSQAAGLVSEKGSLLSHTAIVGRELGIPVVVGVAGATSIFKTGDRLRLDGNAGTVEFANE